MKKTYEAGRVAPRAVPVGAQAPAADRAAVQLLVGVNRVWQTVIEEHTKGLGTAVRLVACTPNCRHLLAFPRTPCDTSHDQHNLRLRCSFIFSPRKFLGVRSSLPHLKPKVEEYCRLTRMNHPIAY